MVIFVRTLPYSIKRPDHWHSLPKYLSSINRKAAKVARNGFLNYIQCALHQKIWHGGTN